MMIQLTVRGDQRQPSTLRSEPIPPRAGQPTENPSRPRAADLQIERVCRHRRIGRGDRLGFSCQACLHHLHLPIAEPAIRAGADACQDRAATPASAKAGRVTIDSSTSTAPRDFPQHRVAPTDNPLAALGNPEPRRQPRRQPRPDQRQRVAAMPGPRHLGRDPGLELERGIVVAQAQRPGRQARERPRKVMLRQAGTPDPPARARPARTPRTCPAPARPRPRREGALKSPPRHRRRP